MKDKTRIGIRAYMAMTPQEQERVFDALMVKLDNKKASAKDVGLALSILNFHGFYEAQR